MRHTARQSALPGDSTEQRDAENWLIEQLAQDLHTTLVRHGAPCVDVTGVELDGFALGDHPILAEAWAHIGEPKPAQKQKVLADALRLLWVERECFPGNQAGKYLVFGDAMAARHFRETSWAARALDSLGIEVRVFPFDERRRESILAAQRRQGAKFAGRQRE